MQELLLLLLEADATAAAARCVGRPDRQAGCKGRARCVGDLRSLLKLRPQRRPPGSRHSMRQVGARALSLLGPA